MSEWLNIEAVVVVVEMDVKMDVILIDRGHDHDLGHDRHGVEEVIDIIDQGHVLLHEIAIHVMIEIREMIEMSAILEVTIGIHEAIVVIEMAIEIDEAVVVVAVVTIVEDLVLDRHLEERVVEIDIRQTKNT